MVFASVNGGAFMKKQSLLFVLIPLPLLLLAAAVYPTQILRIPTSSPAPDVSSQAVQITRIYRAPAVLIESGLEIPDLITNMAFDPDGNLWLSSLEGGPYFYSFRTNELTDMVFQSAVTGLFPGNEGVWILQKENASLYRGTEAIKQVHFPSGIIPLAGLEFQSATLFATTSGIYKASMNDNAAHNIGFKERSYSVALHSRGLLISTDSGLKIWNDNGTKSFLPDDFIPKRGIFASVITTPDGIFAGTDQDGYLQLSRGKWQRLVFARRNLNLNSVNSSAIYRGNPWFGTLDGSVIFQSKGNWHWIPVSEFPVTAVATNGKSLYVWSGGKLLEVVHDEEKTFISSSANAGREVRAVRAQQ
jgi:ligand-binding sensor domain-containing protein